MRVVSAGEGLAWVEPSEQSGCGACASKSACGVGGLSKVFRRGRAPIPVACGEVRPGDELNIGMDETDLLRIGLYAYLLPTVLALVGAGLLSGRGDAAALAGALAGTALGLLLARLLPRAPRLSVRHVDARASTFEPTTPPGAEP